MSITGRVLAAGEYHSLLLADDGSVFAFGQNGAGRLGLGLPVTGLDIVAIATPIEAASLGGLRITKIAAGYDYSLLLAVPVVPEPGAFTLAAACALGFLFYRRRTIS